MVFLDYLFLPFVKGLANLKQQVSNIYIYIYMYVCITETNFVLQDLRVLAVVMKISALRI